MNNDTDYRSDLLSEDQIMMHDATEDAKSDTDTLTLFSIMCDENSSEYGHLFIVAATSQSEAEDLILDDMRLDDSMSLSEVRDNHGFKVYQIDSGAIGSTEYGDGPRIVSFFRT
jgi:hypothetical protein